MKGSEPIRDNEDFKEVERNVKNSIKEQKVDFQSKQQYWCIYPNVLKNILSLINSIGYPDMSRQPLIFHITLKSQALLKNKSNKPNLITPKIWAGRSYLRRRSEITPGQVSSLPLFGLFYFILFNGQKKMRNIIFRILYQDIFSNI